MHKTDLTIIINGQYYDLDTEAPAGTDPFIEGVKFAAAIIEDDRARANCYFEGLKTIKRTSKAATESNRIRNDETKRAIDKLDYIMQTGLESWVNEYNTGKLWKLKV